jgi:hypothetical protein
MDIQSTRYTCTSRDTEKREQCQSRPGERSRLRTNAGVKSDGLKERKEALLQNGQSKKSTSRAFSHEVYCIYFNTQASKQATIERTEIRF